MSVAAAERCLDPIPLEQPILDKLIQAKLTKSLSQSAVSSEILETSTGEFGLSHSLIITSSDSAEYCFELSYL